MAKSLRSRLFPQAQALIAEGVPRGVIAKSLDVNPSTLRRWVRESRGAVSTPAALAGAVPAERPDSVAPIGRAEGGAAPSSDSSADQLSRKIEERLARLIETGDNDAKTEDRMLKLCKVLECLRADEDDLDAQLAAMRKFARFCVRTLCEEEMTPIRKAVRLFLDELQREHS
jgi:transposase-like protein